MGSHGPFVMPVVLAFDGGRERPPSNAKTVCRPYSDAWPMEDGQRPPDVGAFVEPPDEPESSVPGDPEPPESPEPLSPEPEPSSSCAGGT